MAKRLVQGPASPVWLVNADGTINDSENPIVVEMATDSPTVFNVTCTLANTEYSQIMPTNCRFFEFQARTEAILRFAFVSGKVAAPTAPYMTLKAGDYYYSPQIAQGVSPSTIYFASPTAGTVIEIIGWD